MKSAWELAMERAEETCGPIRELSQEQKDAIAEAGRVAEAKIAELRISRQAPIDAAKAAGEAATAALLEDALRKEIQGVEAEREAETARIRGD